MMTTPNIPEQSRDGLLATELAALIEKATDEDLADDGRYFSETFQDLTRCTHGDMGRYDDPADGRLIEFLWNNRRNILAALSRPALEPSDAMVEQIILHVQRYDTPRADDPRRRYTLCQMTTAIRAAITAIQEGTDNGK